MKWNSKWHRARRSRCNTRELLAESGRHSAAAAYLQQLVTRNPLHRAARRMLVEQLLLDNQISAAKLQAKQLREMAANARDYVPALKDTGVAPDSRSERAEGVRQRCGILRSLPPRRH